MGIPFFCVYRPTTAIHVEVCLSQSLDEIVGDHLHGVVEIL